MRPAVDPLFRKLWSAVLWIQHTHAEWSWEAAWTACNERGQEMSLSHSVTTSSPATHSEHRSENQPLLSIRLY